MKLSQKQQEIFDQIVFFFQEAEEPIYVFSGCAGSGKSTIINEISDVFKQTSIAFLAYTGKAAKVLRDKGVHNAQTVHSYLYKPILDEKGNLIGFTKKPREDFNEKYIIVDEGSMLTEEVLADLESLGIKMLIVGDVNQLPPISKSDFNVMENYNVRLEEVHRQSLDNPIIILSQRILHEGILPREKDNDFIKFVSRRNIMEHIADKGDTYDTILCGTNAFRNQLNKGMRTKLGFSGRLPENNEKIICLKNNVQNGNEHYNGDVFNIMGSSKYKNKLDLHLFKLERDDGKIINSIVDDDVWFNGHSVHNHINEQRNGETERTNLDKFDFAYAMTVWKSQGSEYDNLLFVDEDISYFVNRNKFRYTAVTRAKKRITIAK